MGTVKYITLPERHLKSMSSIIVRGVSWQCHDDFLSRVHVYTQYSLLHLLNFEFLRTSYGGKKIHNSGDRFFLLLPLSIHLHFSVFLLVDLILFHWLSLSFPWVSKVWFFQQKLCQIWKYISYKNCWVFFKDGEIPAYMTRISPSKKYKILQE